MTLGPEPASQIDAVNLFLLHWSIARRQRQRFTFILRAIRCPNIFLIAQRNQAELPTASLLEEWKALNFVFYIIEVYVLNCR